MFGVPQIDVADRKRCDRHLQHVKSYLGDSGLHIAFGFSVFLCGMKLDNRIGNQILVYSSGHLAPSRVCVLRGGIDSIGSDEKPSLAMVSVQARVDRSAVKPVSYPSIYEQPAVDHRAA